MTDIIMELEPAYDTEEERLKARKDALENSIIQMQHRIDGIYATIGIDSYEDEVKEIGAKAAYVADVLGDSSVPFDILGKETGIYHLGTTPVGIARDDGLFNEFFDKKSYVTVKAPVEEHLNDIAPGKLDGGSVVERGMTEVYRAVLEDNDISNVEIYDVDENCEAGWIDTVDELYVRAVTMEKNQLELDNAWIGQYQRTLDELHNDLDEVEQALHEERESTETGMEGVA